MIRPFKFFLVSASGRESAGVEECEHIAILDQRPKSRRFHHEDFARGNSRSGSSAT